MLSQAKDRKIARFGKLLKRFFWRVRTFDPNEGSFISTDAIDGEDGKPVSSETFLQPTCLLFGASHLCTHSFYAMITPGASFV